MADVITIRDRKFLSFLVNDPAEVRDLFYRLRLIDEKSKAKRHSFRLERLLRGTARSGSATKYFGTDKDIGQLIALGILEFAGDTVELHDPRESSESNELYTLTELGRDVARYQMAVTEVEKQDARKLTGLGAKGRRAMRKIKDSGELPTAAGMLEDLFYAGMVERTGRGGKVLSPKRAKQLRHEPLVRENLRPTARYRRNVHRLSKTGSYLN